MPIYAITFFLMLLVQSALALAAGYGFARLRNQSAALHYSRNYSFSAGKSGVRLQSSTKYSNQEVPRRAHKRTMPSGSTTSVKRATTTVRKRVQ